MLKSSLLGIFLIGITVSLHGLGTSAWIKFLRKRVSSLKTPITTGTALTILISTTVLLLSLHILEVIVWALAYTALPDLTGPNKFEDALYFSFITFTTVGYGDVTLSGEWRLLSGIEAMNGILLFGWSSALVYATVQRLWFTNHQM